MSQKIVCVSKNKSSNEQNNSFDMSKKIVQMSRKVLMNKK